VVGDEVTQEVELLGVELAFLCLNRASGVSEGYNDFADMFGVFFLVLRVDKDVIEINYTSAVDELLQNVCDEALERGGGVAESKGHY
jgi:hypothetical protein